MKFIYIIKPFYFKALIAEWIIKNLAYAELTAKHKKKTRASNRLTCLPSVAFEARHFPSHFVEILCVIADLARNHG